MTKARLRNNVFLVIAVFVLLLVVASAFKFAHFDAEYTLLKDFSPLLIAIAAAYLAYCFQRRQAFLVSLRDLWKEMIEAKVELIEYTHNPAPDWASFNKAHRALSKTIDSVRGVYKNVGETKWNLGLYPFEPLHDMRQALDELGLADSTSDRRSCARRRIIGSWNALRWAFLKEFSTPEPPHPITKIGARDPRRDQSKEIQTERYPAGQTPPWVSRILFRLYARNLTPRA